MSRAVIDQAGFKVVFIGFIIALILGLTLKSQIAPHRLHALLQDSVTLLEKDFIIDFKKVEIVLSKWGLPLPYLQISQIRMSPKRALCQDSQIYIENLILPLSPISLATSQTLIKEISATQLELRVSDLSNCLDSKNTTTTSSETRDAPVTEAQKFQSEKVVKKIFEIKTSALLEKIKIDQLKIIFKKHPTQPLILRQVHLDLFYEAKQLDRIELVSQLYALKDQQSDLMFFKGELTMQMTSKNLQQVDTQANIRGRLLDGEIQIYSIYNSLEQSVKTDFSAVNVAVKPLMQLNMLRSSWLNYPVALNFKGYGQYQVDGSHMAILRLKDIHVAGERTHIRVPEINLRRDKAEMELDPFIADIRSLNLNKLLQMNQLKSVSQSIENFGEINGVLHVKNLDSMSLSGTWSGLEFIFSNRGLREFQRIDSFRLQGQLQKQEVDLKLSKFILNQKEVLGRADFNYDRRSHNIQADAQLEGELLNSRVWELVTEVPQSPKMKLNWHYRRREDERHAVQMTFDPVKTVGFQTERSEVHYIHTLASGQSASAALAAKVYGLELQKDQFQTELFVPLFQTPFFSSGNRFSSDLVTLNFKGPQWRNMDYEFEGRFRVDDDSKSLSQIRIQGEWEEDESVRGQISIQQPTQLERYDIRKNGNSIELAPL